MVRASIAVVLVATAAFAGCVIFTGGTNGYGSPDAGTSTGSCSSTKECASGLTCCYEIDGGLPSISCQPTCAKWQEACGKASDCGDAGECLSQSCMIEAGPIVAPVTVTTCGVIPFCSQ
jgi:hypothetical protein